MECGWGSVYQRTMGLERPRKQAAVFNQLGYSAKQVVLETFVGREQVVTARCGVFTIGNYLAQHFLRKC